MYRTKKDQLFNKNKPHFLFKHYFILQTNSFQMVLATDEVYTYAIFNYINLVWSSHTEAGGKRSIVVAVV